MCLGVPGQVVEILDAEGHTACVDVAGVRRTVNLLLVRDQGVGVGDYVLVHVGFALSKVDEEEARATLQLLQELGEVGSRGEVGT